MAYAKTIYLDCNNGNDSNSGLTSLLPVKTIAKAMTLVDTENTGIVYQGMGYYTVANLATMTSASYTLTHDVPQNSRGKVYIDLQSTYSNVKIMAKLQKFIGFVFLKSGGDGRVYEYFYDGSTLNLDFRNCVFSTLGSITPTDFIMFTGSSSGAAVTSLRYTNCIFQQPTIVSPQGSDGSPYNGSCYKGYFKNCAFTCTVSIFFTTNLMGIVLKKYWVLGGTAWQNTGINVDNGEVTNIGVYGGTEAWAVPSYKLNFDNISIGDSIPCRYIANLGSLGFFTEFGTCTAPEIPSGTTATPDGLFYWIFAGYDYKGRMKLIADRVLQHSISWDTLNSVGIGSGEGLPTDFIKYGRNIALNQTYLGLNSNNTVSVYLNSDDITKAFNGSTNDLWNPSMDGMSKRAVVDFGNGTIKKVKKVRVKPFYNSGYTNYSPYHWGVCASNDGANWVKVPISTYKDNCSPYNGDEVTTNAGDKWVEVLVDNPTGYRYWGITMYDIYNGNQAWTSMPVSEIEMYEEITSMKFYDAQLRLLSGGTSTTDRDNEWDRIISDSTLNGRIGKCDLGTWLSGAWSWTSSSLDATHKEIRYASGNTSPRGIADTYTITTYSGPTVGFRPMLVVEILNIPPSISLTISNKNAISSLLHIQGSIADDKENFTYKIENETSGVTLVEPTLINQKDTDFSNLFSVSDGFLPNKMNKINIVATDNELFATTTSFYVFVSPISFIVFDKAFFTNNITFDDLESILIISAKYIGTTVIPLYSTDNGVTWNIGTLDNEINVSPTANKVMLGFLMSNDVSFNAYGIGFL